MVFLDFFSEPRLKHTDKFEKRRHEEVTSSVWYIYIFLCIFWSSARILGKPTLSLGRNKSDSRSLVLKMSFRSQVDTIQWYMWANVAHVSITTHRLSLKWRLIIYFDALNSMLQLAFPYGSMSEISSSGWRSKLDPAKIATKGIQSCQMVSFLTLP